MASTGACGLCEPGIQEGPVRLYRKVHESIVLVRGVVQFMGNIS